MDAREIFDNQMREGIAEGWIEELKPEPTGYTFWEYHINETMMGGITRYIQDGIEPGHFLCAVIIGDLFEAVARADKENLLNLRAFTGYFWNEAPSGCFGSQEKMDAWIKMKADYRESIKGDNHD